MPKSKRDKEVSLTKTKKKGKESKSKLVSEIRKCVEAYDHVFVFSMINLRNTKLGQLRIDFKENSRFFCGKNKVMSLALGRIAEEEVGNNLHLVSKRLAGGQCGLLFTNQQPGDIIDFFEHYCEPDYARSGFVATESVELSAGPLPQFPHSSEPQLRKLGMPTSLEKGVVTLLKDFEVCVEKQVLTPEQARILKLLDIKMAEFRVTLIGYLSKADGKYLDLLKKKVKSKPATKKKSVK